MPEFFFGILRFVFYQLYHSMAWTYDFVAAFVSVGQWPGWVNTALSYIQGNRILEIGFGPGHLQTELMSRGNNHFGIDESRQMCAQAHRNLFKRAAMNNARYQGRLVRGIAQGLPYPENCFDTVVSTFPSEYIFDPQTVREIYRVLTGTGNLIIIPNAWIISTRIADRFVKWIYRSLGQAGEPQQSFFNVFTLNGFASKTEWIDRAKGRVMVVILHKEIPNF